MFTGIITDVGEIAEVNTLKHITKIKIKTSYNTSKIALGASVACNGCCLTVTERSKNLLSFDLSPESLKKTNFSKAKKGDRINLEQSLKLGDELGGHIVTGHVDCLCEVAEIKKDKDNWVVSFKVPKEYKKYIAEKGSATVNGVSLTVNYVKDNIFRVNIIPHTLQNSNLTYIKKGSLLNLEIDILARYIERQLTAK